MVAREYVPIANLLPLIEISCQGVPRSVALFELRQAYNDFCNRTWLWQSDIIPFAIQDGVDEYELTTTAEYSQPYLVQALSADGMPLTSVANVEVERSKNFGKYHEKQGKPKFYIAKDAGIVEIYPKEVDVVITGRLILAPTDDAEMMPKSIYTDFGRCISYMVKAALMMQPNKPWTNPQLATLNIQLSNQLIDDALHKASRGHSAAPKRRVKSYFY